MLKPDVIGPKQFFLNPGITEFDSTIVAAIDSTIDNAASAIQPYAYTATVSDHYDARNFFGTELTGFSLVAGKRLAFGLFLSPSNDKGNLLFQVSGRLQFCTAENYQLANFIFGRKATNNTVVSSTTTAENALASYTLLTPTSEGNYSDDSANDAFINMGIQTEIFSLESSGGYNYFFGVILDNPNGTDCGIGPFACSLAIRKYYDVLNVYRPTGS